MQKPARGAKAGDGGPGGVGENSNVKRATLLKVADAECDTPAVGRGAVTKEGWTYKEMAARQVEGMGRGKRPHDARPAHETGRRGGHQRKRTGNSEPGVRKEKASYRRPTMHGEAARGRQIAGAGLPRPMKLGSSSRARCEACRAKNASSARQGTDQLRGEQAPNEGRLNNSGKKEVGEQRQEGVT